MTKTISVLDTEKFKLIDRALTELATEIQEKKTVLFKELICRYVSEEDLEDFCDLYAGAYAFKKHEASGQKLVNISDL